MKTEKNNADLLMVQSILDQLNQIDPLGSSDDPMETRRPNLRPFAIERERYEADVVIIDHWIDESFHGCDHWTIGHVWRDDPSKNVTEQWLIVTAADDHGTDFRGIRTDCDSDDGEGRTFQCRREE